LVERQKIVCALLPLIGTIAVTHLMVLSLAILDTSVLTSLLLVNIKANNTLNVFKHKNVLFCHFTSWQLCQKLACHVWKAAQGWG